MGELIGSIHTKKGCKAQKQREEPHDRAREDLDKSVKKRPIDLARANEELMAVNERLRRENEQLLQAEASLAERLRFEQLLSDLSARLIEIQYDEVDAAIETALGKILEFFQVDRCGLVRVSRNDNNWRITHVAYASGVSPVPKNTDSPPYDVPLGLPKNHW